MAEMDKKTEDFDLDAMFADMRTQDVVPAPDFMARVLADALDAQAAAAPVTVAPRPPSRLRQLLAAIGGWPAVAGLATAGVAGLWIGVNPPASIMTTAESFLGTTVTDQYLVDLMPSYEFAMAEG
ncbi:hypothetical protein SAMN06265173_10369 [Thalassovita litoralis]|jgi:hypothetical protein|uniref:Dihydroorotate dehydrogenase n=1 Tax=Thalassovita litoralis TaxID=1010611 RepID=A0A521BJA1_9RHOB|nr:dihydroorotate dehydrogenase [Thalassovita litoralis]SMO46951.1 hypothetical protein SAMN06265173_10369 [Thalassovita litoralis]